MGGLQPLKVSLARELVKPTQFIHEDLEIADDIGAVTRKIFHANIAALQDTLTILDTSALERAVGIINAAQRIELYGIGSAAPIAAPSATLVGEPPASTTTCTSKPSSMALIAG